MISLFSARFSPPVVSRRVRRLQRLVFVRTAVRWTSDGRWAERAERRSFGPTPTSSTTTRVELSEGATIPGGRRRLGERSQHRHATNKQQRGMCHVAQLTTSKKSMDLQLHFNRGTAGGPPGPMGRLFYFPNLPWDRTGRSPCLPILIYFNPYSCTNHGQMSVRCQTHSRAGAHVLHLGEFD